MKNLLLILLFIASYSLAYGQTDYSIHSFDFFKNNKKRNINVSEIWIIVGGTKIKGEKIGEFFHFPLIDSYKTFEFGIKTNRMDFKSGLLESWMLNNGSKITLGKITNVDKLLSVGEYNERDESDDNYYIFAKRFFIAGDAYTIDIDNYEKVKRVKYLIIDPKQEGDGGYVLVQEIVKSKK